MQAGRPIFVQVMAAIYTENQRFENIDFTQQAPVKGSYEGCTFVSCNFSAADLGGLNFVDCEFTACNLSNCKVVKTGLRQCRFVQCKLLGLRFDTCNDFLFVVSFDKCRLDFASFFKVKLKGTIFKDCSLREVDFAQADLTSAVLGNCDLKDATFGATNLERADFRTAFNYSINPTENKLKQAKFSALGLAGLLDGYDIIVE